MKIFSLLIVHSPTTTANYSNKQSPLTLRGQRRRIDVERTNREEPERRHHEGDEDGTGCPEDGTARKVRVRVAEQAQYE